MYTQFRKKGADQEKTTKLGIVAHVSNPST